MVLRKKYPTDKEFSTLLQLTGEMDAQMVEIENLLCDEKLFELIEADLSPALSTDYQNRKRLNPSRSNLTDVSSQTLTRLLSQTKEIISNYTLINSQVFRNRNRTARKISREIDKLSTTRNKWGRQKREKLYLKLINVTKAS